MVEIRRLRGGAHVAALGAILHDCVEGGASVSFVKPFSMEMAEAFYRSIAGSVEQGERILLGAFVDRDLLGTVQVILAMPPNQTHRGEIAKLLVSRAARGAGIGQALMSAAETCAREAGKTLLTLDTSTGSSAERLYERLGWIKAGVIPNYAVYPDGSWGDTTFFWKAISSGTAPQGAVSDCP